MENRQLGPTTTVMADRELAWYRGDSVRYLSIGVTAPTVPADPERAQRRRLNLAVVVDASGSMASGELEAAKGGLIGIVERLHDDDVVSIVSFDDEAQVHVARQPVGQERQPILNAAASIETGGTTNLSGGWLKGAEQAALAMDRHPDCRHRVIVLSDGHANRGITEPELLAAHAEQLRVRRLASSAIGIGEGYSPVQLEAIAAYGGGRLHHAASASEIVEVMLGELEESQETVLEDIMIAVRTPPGVRHEMLSTFPTVQTADGMTATLGSLGSGKAVKAIVRVNLPAGEEDGLLPFDLEVSWICAGETVRRRHSIPRAVGIQLVRGETNNAQGRDIETSLEVVGAWEAAIVREAVDRNRQGDFLGARSYVDDQLSHLARYCNGLPGTSEVLANIRRLREAIGRAWEERYRREARIASYKQSRREVDVRHGYRTWSDAIPPRQ